MTRNFLKLAETRWLVRCVLLAVAGMTSIGCASQGNKDAKLAAWDVRRAWTKEEEKPEPQVPTRIVATWTDTVLNKAGQKPLRGFGGRISFFNRESDDPVRVDGQLVVYAFDETARESYQTEPARKFVFPAEQVALHEGDSKVGTSYSFWLPWDEAGGPQRNISLITRFEPKDGPIVMGEQTKHFLPGASPEPMAAPQLATSQYSEAVNAVRLATYSQQAAGAVPDLAEPVTPVRPQMSTATIALPKGVSLGAAKQAAAAPPSVYVPANVPLSQLTSLGKGAPPELVSGERAPATQPASTPTARTTAAGAAAAGPAGAESLRDSLLRTLPARGTLGAPVAPGRAR
jgi:hypothetical protein